MARGDARRLWVRDLPGEFSEEGLRKLISEAGGEVIELWMMPARPGRATFARVELESREQVLRVCQKLDGHVIDRDPICAHPVEPLDSDRRQEPSRPTPGATPEARDDEMRDLLNTVLERLDELRRDVDTLRGNDVHRDESNDGAARRADSSEVMGKVEVIAQTLVEIRDAQDSLSVQIAEVESSLRLEIAHAVSTVENVVRTSSS